MANEGLIITLDGYDADTATPEQCVLHSDYANPKIRTDASPVHIDYFNYAFSGNPTPGVDVTLKTVAHGFSYTPIAIVYFRQNDPTFTDDFKLLPWFYTSSNGFARVNYYTDGTNLKIIFHRTSDGGFNDAIDLTGLNFDFKYYIFVEDGI